MSATCTHWRLVFENSRTRFESTSLHLTASIRDTGQQPAEELVSNHYQSERSPDSYTSNGQSNGVDPRSNVEKAEQSLESAQKLLSLEALRNDIWALHLE